MDCCCVHLESDLVFVVAQSSISNIVSNAMLFILVFIEIIREETSVDENATTPLKELQFLSLGWTLAVVPSTQL